MLVREIHTEFHKNFSSYKINFSFLRYKNNSGLFLYIY
nr:MAG TPA: hypothetical protein [Caudoviricetes sp.]